MVAAIEFIRNEVAGNIRWGLWSCGWIKGGGKKCKNYVNHLNTTL